MIQTYSTTIRRKEMDAVLTCMVDEKIGPGELNGRFIAALKDFLGFDGAIALRSPFDALKYAFRALNFEAGQSVLVSALAPAWHLQAVEDLGYKAIVLDVDENSGLVTEEIVKEGINQGGRLLLLHESMGMVPDVQKIISLGIPVIEDISKSAGARVTVLDENGEESDTALVGSFGVYSILGLEEHDIITAGGGAVLFAPKRREWIVLKKFAEEMARTELLPDINCALGWVQVKEFKHNEIARKKIYDIFKKASLSGRHTILCKKNTLSTDEVEQTSSVDISDTEKTENEEIDYSFTACAFPLVLSTSFKDVKQYTAKKEIEIVLAYEDSVISIKQDELSSSCIKAKSLYLRTALFPLYPRLSHVQVSKIAKVLGTLP